MLEIIYKVSLDNKVFYTVEDNRLVGYYLRKSLLNVFSKIIKKGFLIKFSYSSTIIKNKVKLLEVENIYKITSPSSNRVLFDIDYVRKKILSNFDLNKYYLFLDFEATFAKYGEQTEIIEAGVVIAKPFYEPVVSRNFYIYPRSINSVNYRTVRFLHLDLNEYEEQAIYFSDYNSLMKEYEIEYNPIIITWGSFDGSILKKSCLIHDCEILNYYKNIINLQQVHKHFNNSKNDEGLFSTYEKYYGHIHKQTHNPNEDSLVTKLIFEAFIIAGSNYLKRKKLKLNK
jgi:inhibitor of KinA sporulation pathway (predicted exonuclease)